MSTFDRGNKEKDPAVTYFRAEHYHRPSLLNDCVRYGYRCFQRSIATGSNKKGRQRRVERRVRDHLSLPLAWWRGEGKKGQADRPISTGQLNTLLCLHLRPINLVVYKEPDRDTYSWRGLRA